MSSIREQLLQLSDEEIFDRKKAKKDFFFYMGACEDEEAAKLDEDLLGQTWLTADRLDYKPSKLIDNKTKKLIKKQARFMLGDEPTLLFKARDLNDKEEVENLRIFIDDILNSNHFWSQTLQAFRLATVTRQVLLRIEANPGQAIKINYHDYNDFKYIKNTQGQLTQVYFVRQRPDTIGLPEEEQIWHRFIYSLESNNKEEVICILKEEEFKGDNLEKPINTIISNTGLHKIPCFLIVNDIDMINTNGESDIRDLKVLQDMYNRRFSDFADALRFQMFDQSVVTDATDESVETINIAPNALVCLKSRNDKEGTKAEFKKVSSSFSSSEPINTFLDRIDKAMRECLDMPDKSELNKAVSAKAIKYLYNDLIARCEEKWKFIEPQIRAMIRLIINCCDLFNIYPAWNNNWNSLQFSIVLQKNYPLPEDVEDQKKLALEEVTTNVKSIRDYIKDYGNNEDVEKTFKEILEDLQAINEVNQDQFLPANGETGEEEE